MEEQRKLKFDLSNYEASGIGLVVKFQDMTYVIYGYWKTGAGHKHRKMVLTQIRAKYEQDTFEQWAEKTSKQYGVTMIIIEKDDKSHERIVEYCAGKKIDEEGDIPKTNLIVWGEARKVKLAIR